MRPEQAAALVALTLALSVPAAAGATPPTARMELLAKAANQRRCALGPATPGGVAGQRLAALARGFNLAGWLDSLSPQPPGRGTLAALNAAGFTHIRLPILAEGFMPRFTSEPDRKAHVRDLDAALDQLLAARYAVIIDLAPGSDFAALAHADPVAALDEVEEAWDLIAPRQAARPRDRVFFELLNEPPMEDAVWSAGLARLIPAVRRLAPQTTLIVGPAPWQRFEALARWQPFGDRNIAYAFHFYDPMAFTHQGMSWDPQSPFAALANVPFPAAEGDPRVAAEVDRLERAGAGASADELRRAYAQDVDAATITASFAQVAAWAATNDRPVIVDEFGVLAERAPSAARRAWIAAVRGAAERFCFGWTHWEFAQGFGFVDPGTGRVDAGMLEALLGTRRKTSTRP